MKYKLLILSILSSLLSGICLFGQTLIPIDKGWSNNSVNVTIFRKNSLITVNNTQYVSYYSPDSCLMLGKRSLNSENWTIHKTQYKGNVNDAHNSICMMVDSDGYLHVAWDHHGSPLRYAKSLKANDLELGDEESMTGLHESDVTYPEFSKLPDGNLIFMYRDGRSGSGNLAINKYDCKLKEWIQIQDNLISGEGRRNAYWQAYIDAQGIIHLSWVWRESWLVESNHDMCYARSDDGGITWKNTRGEKYDLPITAATAEYICNIPQNSELINQTSMTTDHYGNPYIATYWREKGSEIPQYHVIFHNGKKWNTSNLNFRETSFSLKGGGTKKIPISRPLIIAKSNDETTTIGVIFRDEERGSKASIAICDNLAKNKWRVEDLTTFTLGSWEPTFDTELWKIQQELHLFIQNVEQVDGEGRADLTPQEIQVLELKNILK